MNFDEVQVKGVSFHQQITIPLKKLSNKEVEEFKNCLINLQTICQKLITFIDSSEDSTVSFAVYNGFKKLADLDLNSNEDKIVFEFEGI